MSIEFPENMSQSQAVRIPAGITDLDSFRSWARSDDYPGHAWISYVGGETIVDMSPEEIETHNKVKGAIFSGLRRLLDPQDVGNCSRTERYSSA